MIHQVSLLKILLLAVFTLSFIPRMDAQDRVEYYKLTKWVNNGVTKTPTSDIGQFVTRNKDICYESKSNGSMVGNGHLKLQNQNNEAVQYYGTCYYGNNCYFTFYDAKGVLNVRTPDGTVYVYKRATPPAGKTTCSLIRSNNDTSPIPYVPTPVNNQPSNNTKEKSRHTCNVCGGTGEKIKLYYSGGKFKWCEKCHKEVDAGHHHQTCDYCNGKGYVEY